MKVKQNEGLPFRFRRNDNIGAAMAEADDKFLSQCFVDTGDLSALANVEDPRRIVVGRTGAGKTALLSQLRQVQDNVVELSPQSVSLTYVSNSEVIQFFEAAGVNLV